MLSFCCWHIIISHLGLGLLPELPVLRHVGHLGHAQGGKEKLLHVDEGHLKQDDKDVGDPQGDAEVGEDVVGNEQVADIHCVFNLKLKIFPINFWQ